MQQDNFMMDQIEVLPKFYKKSCLRYPFSFVWTIFSQKLWLITEKANLRRMERPNSVVDSNRSSTSPNNNSEVNPLMLAGESICRLSTSLLINFVYDVWNTSFQKLIVLYCVTSIKWNNWKFTSIFVQGWSMYLQVECFKNYYLSHASLWWRRMLFSKRTTYSSDTHIVQALIGLVMHIPIELFDRFKIASLIVMLLYITHFNPVFEKTRSQC